MKDFSIVIPAYRAQATIMRTLDSIKSSTIPPADIIIVEDGVYDNLQDLLCDREDLKLLTKSTNAGAASARNTGLDAVQSKYVIFLDSDDYVSDQLFEELVCALDDNEGDVVFGPWTFVYNDVPSPSIKQPTRQSNDQFISRWLQNECFPPCCVMWRSDTLRRIGGWNESFKHNDDAELVIRALLAGFKVAVTNKGCGYYVQHDSPHRVSRASSSVASEAADRIFAMVSAHYSVVHEEMLHNALATFAYEQARRAYRAGEARLGGLWHERARAYGMKHHVGSAVHKMTARILGLRVKERLASLRDIFPALKHRYK